MRRGRRLALDIGEVRIGVATCDPDGLIATPVETVASDERAIDRLVELVLEYEPIEVFAGLPIGLSGREGPAAAKARDFASRLAARIPAVPVRLFDERMSTVTAQGNLHASGRSTKKSRRVIDQAAAVVILQSALEAERKQGKPVGELLEGFPNE